MYKYLILALVAAASVHAANIEPSRGASDSCQSCKSIVSFAGKFNSSENRPDLKQVFTEFCQLYNPVSTDNQQGLCPLMVDTLFYLLDRVDPVTFCDEVGACDPEPQAGGLTVVFDNLVNSGVVCNVCQDVLAQLQSQLQSPQFIKIVRGNIDALCEYLKVVGEEEECKQVLNENFDAAIDFIRTMDPVKYCQSISLCTSNATVRLSSRPTLADFSNFGIETNVDIGRTAVVLHEGQTQGGDHGPNCLFCKVIIKEMFKFLKENKTEENIERALDSVCALVYTDKNKLDQCDQMVNTYSKELVSILADETDPDLVCMLLEQCYSKSGPKVKSVDVDSEKTDLEPINVGQFISLLDPSVPVGSMRSCAECKIFIKFLRSSIEDPKSVDQVKNWLKQNLCGSVNDNKLRSQCVDMIDTYADAFFKGVLMELSPQATCVELGACKKRQRLFIDNLAPTLEPVEPVLIKNSASDKRPATASMPKPCDICTDIITDIDNYLSKHDINQDVNVIVDQVCKKMPVKKIESECTYLVKNYGQEIIQAIAVMDNPRQLCSSLGFC